MQGTLDFRSDPTSRSKEEASVYPRPRLLTRHRIVRKLFPKEVSRKQSHPSATPSQCQSHTPDAQELTFRLLLAQQQRKYEQILEKHNIEERPAEVVTGRYSTHHAHAM